MRERVVIKWGGGLITEKQTMKTVRKEVLDNLANQLEACLTEGIDVVLVHGAGSFGHLKAKEYRLAEGRQPTSMVPSNMTQDEAVEAVRHDMQELNQYLAFLETKLVINVDKIRCFCRLPSTAPLGEQHWRRFPRRFDSF